MVQQHCCKLCERLLDSSDDVDYLYCGYYDCGQYLLEQVSKTAKNP